MTAQIIRFPTTKKAVAEIQSEAPRVPEVGDDLSLPFCFFAMYLQYFGLSSKPEHQEVYKKLQTALRKKIGRDLPELIDVGEEFLTWAKGETNMNKATLLINEKYAE